MRAACYDAVSGQQALGDPGGGQPCRHREAGQRETALPQPGADHDIAERWIGKFERHRLQALSELKKGLETRDE